MTATVPAVPREVTVIKLGGSLITDKTRRDAVCDSRINDLGAVLTRRLRRARGHVILVMGGGSVGHFAARDMGLARRMANPDLSKLQSMASKMYALKSRLAETLSSQRLPALAFQETSFLVALSNGRVVVHDQALRQALALRIVPILSGGAIFDEARGMRALNGDLLALALDPRVFAVRRVIMLTDVPGVLDTKGDVIRHLDAASRRRMSTKAGPAGRVDVTGGMRGKVVVALALAQRGIHTVICSGVGLSDERFDEVFAGRPAACSLAGFSTRNTARRGR